MSRVSDTKLRAYLDGEADEGVIAEVEHALKTNPAVRESADLMTRSKTVLSEALAGEFQPPEDLKALLKAMAEGASEGAAPPSIPAETPAPPPKTPDSSKKYQGFWGILRAANTNRFRGLLAVAACLGLVFIASEEKVREIIATYQAPAGLTDLKLRSAQLPQGHNEEIDFGDIVPEKTATLRALLYRKKAGKFESVEVANYVVGDVINLAFTDKIAFYFEAKQNVKVSLLLVANDGTEISLIREQNLSAGAKAKSIEILAEPPAAAGDLILKVQPQALPEIRSKIPIAITK